MRTPLSHLRQQLKGPRREINFVNQAKHFFTGCSVQLKNQAGENSFCKSVKITYVTSYHLGAGGDGGEKYLLQDKELMCMCI